MHEATEICKNSSEKPFFSKLSCKLQTLGWVGYADVFSKALANFAGHLMGLWNSMSSHASWKISACLDCNLFLKFAFCTEFFPVNSTWRAFCGMMLISGWALELQCTFPKAMWGDFPEPGEKKQQTVCGWCLSTENCLNQFGMFWGRSDRQGTGLSLILGIWVGQNIQKCKA